MARTDTVTVKKHDKIVRQKDRLKVQLVKVNDTITIDAICDSDTIISVVEVPYDKIIYIEKESPMQVVQRWLLYMVFIFLGYRGVLKLLGHR